MWRYVLLVLVMSVASALLFLIAAFAWRVIRSAIMDTVSRNRQPHTADRPDKDNAP